ncbi:MAG TPA: hypothetical protein VLZ11_09730 [Flavobacterium sp.]|nr:hypothetical protein [Flavobacterium sp.]
MKFVNRLALFLLGLLVGVLFLIFFFKGKFGDREMSFCYLPNCRALKDMRSKPFYYSDQASQKMKQGLLDTVQLKDIFKNGDVHFKKSNIPMEGGKYYLIEGKLDGKKTIFVEVINTPEKITLRDIYEK